MQFSQTYYNTLTPMQHAANNAWFAQMLSYLKEDGVLYVPVLDKRFNKQGEDRHSLRGALRHAAGG